MKIDNKMMKTLTTIFMRSKKTIIDHAPQIMAVAGCGCFMAATYCAMKETPKALEKLEEKKALDPNMSGLQKMAVLVPEFKGCISFTALGLGLSFGAWKIESIRFAEMSAVAAAALKDNERLIAAAKEVVGENETRDILDKKQEMVENDLEAENQTPWYTQDNIPYPFLFDNGTKIWTTWGNFKWHMEQLVQQAAENTQLHLYEYFSELNLPIEELRTKYIQENGWQPGAGTYAMNFTSADWLQWAREVLEYEPEPYEEDHYRHISGWKIHWKTSPSTWDDSRA